jgi:hypothetical protein
MKRLHLTVLPDPLAVCRLASNAPLPDWPMAGPLTSITRTADELSIVCLDRAIPEEVIAERGWRCLKVQGPLEFSVTGILAELAGTLAAADISLFALSTFDTDYLLVKQETLPAAIAALEMAGHRCQTTN